MENENRLMDVGMRDEDELAEGTLRPKRLDEYIGQKRRQKT